MSIRRVMVLFGKELVRGPRNFLFIMAVVVPVVITLLLSLLFGSFFSGKARLAVLDQGDSRLPEMAEALASILVERSPSEQELVEAVERGAVDIGVVLPMGFDESVASGEPVELEAYIWGQSQLKHRTILATAVVTLVRQIAGQESPVEIEMTALGDEDALPWEERLLPFIVLLSVLIGGVMATSTSVVEEKAQRTLTALTVTPTTLGEVLAAKGLLGVTVSTLMGVVTLALNGAFGRQSGLLVLTLTMGAAMASIFGVLLGMWAKDINTLFATIKTTGIFLYAPALIYMFPEIPQWIGRIFPTYYIIQPVVDLIQEGAGWGDVAVDLGILAALILALLALTAWITPRAALREV